MMTDIIARPTYAIGHIDYGMLMKYEDAEPVWSGRTPVDIHNALAFPSAYEAYNFIAIYLEFWPKEIAADMTVWKVLPKPRLADVVPFRNSPTTNK